MHSCRIMRVYRGGTAFEASHCSLLYALSFLSNSREAPVYQPRRWVSRFTYSSYNGLPRAQCTALIKRTSRRTYTYTHTHTLYIKYTHIQDVYSLAALANTQVNTEAMHGTRAHTFLHKQYDRPRTRYLVSLLSLTVLRSSGPLLFYYRPW